TYVQKNSINLVIDQISSRNRNWETYDFTSYDTVLHLAGLVHKKETKKNRHLYYEINRDLAVSVAKKSKAAGIKHFIFMSTMSVYGLTEGTINKNTVEIPANAY